MSTGGFFQKTLARTSARHCAGAHEEGKPGISFGRLRRRQSATGFREELCYRCHDSLTLEEGMAKYEPKEVDITIAVETRWCKGIESWAWYGLQPINRS